MGLDDILSNAREVVRKVVPGTVEITNIEFEGPTIVLYTKNMDVFAENNDLVRQLAPGLVIGHHGSVLNEIKKKIGWAPKVVRTPPIPSKTVEEIRQYLRSVREDRLDFLKGVGRRLNREVASGETWVRVTSLGRYRPG